MLLTFDQLQLSQEHAKNIDQEPILFHSGNKITAMLTKRAIKHEIHKIGDCENWLDYSYEK